jgi:hypothetical protein
LAVVVELWRRLWKSDVDEKFGGAALSAPWI